MTVPKSLAWDCSGSRVLVDLGVSCTHTHIDLNIWRVVRLVQWMAQDSLNFGRGYTAFSTGSGVEPDLVPGKPASDGPGIDA